MPQPKTGIHGPLLLEEPLIRTPYELLRRSHRSAQRQVERDFVAVQTQLSSLLKSFSGDPDKDRDPAVTKLDALSERARGLKRKLDDLQPAPGASSALRDRITYVDDTLLAKVIEVKVEIETDDEPTEVSSGNGRTEPAEEVTVKVETIETLPITTSPRPPVEDRTLDRYIIDHLLRSGRMKTARAVAEAQGIENLVDIKLFAELVRIEMALMDKQSCTEALAWCGENRGTLKKQASDLEFVLRLQEFIELCRKRETTAAIAYSRKNFQPWSSTHMEDIQRGMTLLAFGEKTGVATYRQLYSSSRWATVRDKFRDTFLNLYALPSQSLLALSLSAGLSSLRLPACSAHTPSAESPRTFNAALPPRPAPLLSPVPDLHAVLGLDSLIVPDVSRLAEPPKVDEEPEPPSEPPSANIDCPTCAPDLRILAREVPMAHHVNSTIVCRISGAVMDSENEPMAFPNGHVYSSKALQEMAKNNFDIVTCPLTNETCRFSRLRKVYIS